MSKYENDSGRPITNIVVWNITTVGMKNKKPATKSSDLLCDLCDFKTSKKNTLEAHKQTKHVSHPERSSDYVCDSCDFKTSKEDTLKAHKQSKHVKRVIKCDRCTNCDFVAQSDSQMKKHTEVRHTNRKTCWYWQDRGCDNTYCRFEHPPRGTQDNTQCYYQERCQRTDCQYTHNRRSHNNSGRACRYQQFFSNRSCRFEHFLDQHPAPTQGWW